MYNSFVEISNIVRVAQNYYFICLLYKIERFDSFLNSFQVERCNSSERIVVKVSDLIYFKSYDMKKIGRNRYIVSDTIDLKEALDK